MEDDQMEEIKIYKRPKLKNPYLIAAWPGMGEVAFKAAGYLVDKLQAIEFAQIPSEPFFYLTGSIVREGILAAPELPEGKFYYYKNKKGRNDLIIFVSNGQPDLAKAESYCSRIVLLAKAFKVKTVISLAAMPQPMDHVQAPNVWFASTTKELNDSLKKLRLNLLLGGQISGMNGLFLGHAKNAGFDGFCLLAEVPLYTIQIENPKASLAVLETLVKILNIQIDFTGLIEQAHNMEGEINKLMDYLNLAPSLGPIGEDDIEKIKKTLSQLTNLPVSVKEKIERLFVQSRTDISKANELKFELDKWSVYKEYEDRFLDLFKKKKDDNN